MGKASTQDIAAMDAAQAETERVLRLAEGRAALIEQKWSVIRTNLEEASLSSIRSGRLQFSQWADGRAGLRRYALDGRTEDGRPYTVQEWLAYGRELAQRMAAEAKAVVSSGLYLYTPAAVLRPVVEASAGAGVKVESKVRQAADAAAEFFENPPKVPTHLKAAAWVLGGTLVVGVLAYGLSQVNALASLLPKKEEA